MLFVHITISWLLEFGPNLLFFVTFNEFGFIQAAKILMIANVAVLFYTLLVRRHIVIFPLASGALIISFGIFTVYFNDPQWLIIESTIHNAIFAIAIFGSLLMRKNLLEKLFGELFAISSRGWHVITRRWGYYFVLQVIGNELMRLNFSVDAWVVYRFLMTFVLFSFAVTQIPLVRRERLAAQSNHWGLRIK